MSTNKQDLHNLHANYNISRKQQSLLSNIGNDSQWEIFNMALCIRPNLLSPRAVLLIDQLKPDDVVYNWLLAYLYMCYASGM